MKDDENIILQRLLFTVVLFPNECTNTTNARRKEDDWGGTLYYLNKENDLLSKSLLKPIFGASTPIQKKKNTQQQ